MNPIIFTKLVFIKLALISLVLTLSNLHASTVEGFLNIDFDNAVMSPDGRWFAENRDVGGGALVLSLISVDTGEIISIGPKANTFQFTQDSQYLVFVSVNGKTKLSSIKMGSPLGANNVLAASGSHVQGGAALPEFKLSNNSEKVVFTSDFKTAGVNEIYSVAVSGGTGPVVLNANMPAGGDVGILCRDGLNSTDAPIFKISPDSTKVVYQADQEIDQEFNIYGVDIEGVNDSVRINAAAAQLTSFTNGRDCFGNDGGDGIIIQDGFGILGFDFSPQSDRIVYSLSPSQQAQGGSQYRFSVRSNLAFGGDDQLVYQGTDGGLTDELLFDVPQNGNRILIRELVFGFFARYKFSFVSASLIEPDSKILYESPAQSIFAAYLGDSKMTHDGQNVIFTIPTSFTIGLAGEIIFISDMNSGVTKPLTVLPEGTALGVSESIFGSPDEFFVGNDSDLIYFLQTNKESLLSDLFVVSIADGTKRKINRSHITNGSVDFYSVSDDGSTVVYFADHQSNNFFELFGSLPVPSNVEQINESFGFPQEITGFLIGPKGDFVIYELTNTTTNVVQTFKSDISIQEAEEELCFPVKNNANSFSVLCL